MQTRIHRVGSLDVLSDSSTDRIHIFSIPFIDVIVHKRIRLLFDSDTIGFSLNLLSSPTFSTRIVYHASGVMLSLRNEEKVP